MTSLKALPPGIVTIGVWASTYRFCSSVHNKWHPEGVPSLPHCVCQPRTTQLLICPFPFSSWVWGVDVGELKLPGLLENTVACSGTGQVQVPVGLQCVSPNRGRGTLKKPLPPGRY